MPIYEYRCLECGYEMDTLQKISDPPLTDCPACARPAMQKLVSAAAFRLKGGGWYETDFKSGKQKNVTKPDAGEPKAKAGKKTDSGPKSASAETKKSA